MEIETPGLDRWRGRFGLARNTRREYTIEAWMGPFEAWRSEVRKKVDDGQVVELELLEGRAIVARAAEHSGDQRLPRLSICSVLLSGRPRSLAKRLPTRSASRC